MPTGNGPTGESQWDFDARVVAGLRERYRQMPAAFDAAAIDYSQLTFDLGFLIGLAERFLARRDLVPAAVVVLVDTWRIRHRQIGQVVDKLPGAFVAEPEVATVVNDQPVITYRALGPPFRTEADARVDAALIVARTPAAMGRAVVRET